MRLVVRAAEATAADGLIGIKRAHVDSCLYHGEASLILSIGAAVAEELYGVAVPVVVLPPGELAAIPDGGQLRIGPEGVVRRA